MDPKILEAIEKLFDDKFSQLRLDVDKSVVDKMEKEFKERWEELKKSRDWTPNAGATPDKYANIKAFHSLAKGSIDREVMGNLKDWPEEVIRGLAGYAKAVYMREHGQNLDEAITKALGETRGQLGGFFVPIAFTP